MNKADVYNPDEIIQAVKDIKKIKPDFGPMLDLYQEIFIAQEDSMNRISLSEFSIPEDVLSVKLKEGFPLLDIPQFRIDSKESGKLFNELCGILTESSNELTEAVKRITELCDNKKTDPETLFSAFIHEDESFFDNMEQEHDIDKAVLGFIVYNSLKPSLTMFSKKMSGYLDNESVWEKGYCPVCGSLPELSVFEDNGKRSLICGFCGHKWLSKRIYCPFCENTDHESLQYFDIEGEEEYRVDVCDKCKKYIKTVDIKKTSRTVYLPLENRSTPYLDMRFSEMGYKAGNMRSD